MHFFKFKSSYVEFIICKFLKNIRCLLFEVFILIPNATHKWHKIIIYNVGEYVINSLGDDIEKKKRKKVILKLIKLLNHTNKNT